MSFVAIAGAVLSLLPPAHHHKRHHHHRRASLKLALPGAALASWYDDQGETACGFHAGYGFASLTLPCGTRVLMRGPSGRTVSATMQDRGPYVPGRTFDLNPALRGVLGCPDLCWVRYRVL